MIQKKEVEIAKEVDEVLDFLLGLVKDIKDKKEITVIASDALPNLVKAISDFDQIPLEAKNVQALAQTVALKLSELVAIFLDDKPKISTEV